MSLPVDEVLPQLIAALAAHGQAVLVAPTGAGKTTRVPGALLDAGLAGDGAVVMLEPRRLAARAAARRMASDRGETLGAGVGYRVRFDSCAGDATRLLVVTEGLFVRRLADDPLLEGVGAVVFDEFHERHLDSDLALAMLRRVRQELRPDLPLVVMSATLEGERVSEALGGCPVVTAEGRLHPVEIAYLPHALDGPLEQRVELGLRDALQRTDGDVLVFLPGVGEIRAAARRLAPLAAERDLALVELFGDLAGDQQDAALRSGPRRKVVLSTNVAESSVTVEGVTAVVDTGLARVLRHDPDSGLDRLVLEPVSRASADQRAGRAGRTAPGFCARLWTRGEHANRPAQLAPELQRADLSGAVLQLAAWGERRAADMPWLEPPEPAGLATAAELLVRLGAAVREDDGGLRVTSRGRELARLPLAPRLGNLLLEGRDRGVLREAALAAAVLSERDPLARREPAAHVSACDLCDRVDALEGGAAGRGGAARQVQAAADQLRRMVDGERGATSGGGGGRGASRRSRGSARGRRGAAGPAGEPLHERLPRALLAAFPDRVARRRPGDRERVVMVGRRGARLDPTSAVKDGDLLLCVALQGAARGEPRARLVSRLRREWLDPSLVTRRLDVRFDSEREAVVARQVTAYEDLVLQEDPAERPDPDELARVLAAAASEQLERALDPSRPEVADLRARVATLAVWHPELGMPALGDDDLRAVLPRLCAGARSFAELRRADLAGALRGTLDGEQSRALASLAPDRITVPSGSRLRLDYDPTRPPSLAVAIQELFGQAETPRVDGGRVPVVLHLLAPNRRAQQVTDDLGSFWRNTYPQVRRELSRRYPRHDWPEDPLAAAPSNRPKARRRK